MRVYRGKIEARSESNSLYTFLKISPQKINTSKRAKLGPIEVNVAYTLNMKSTQVNITNILNVFIKSKKSKKRIFFIEVFFIKIKD